MIQKFFSRRPTLPKQPGTRDALFYPSSGEDFITPLLLGLPFCSQFIFYDSSNYHAHYFTKLNSDLKQVLFEKKSIEDEGYDDGDSISFYFHDIRRTIHLVRKDNQKFLSMDVDLAFYFHRGDDCEGGSEQEWDSTYIFELFKKIAKGGVCQVVTNEEPGGSHDDLPPLLLRFEPPISERNRAYFLGEIPSDFLSKINEDKSEKEAE